MTTVVVVKKAGQIAKSRMNHSVVANGRNHQAHLIASQAARLRRLGGLKLGRKLEL